MEELAKNVYIEDKYMGVTVAVISQPRGLVQIDAPPSPEDGRSWRASLMGMGNGPERVLINLDAHPDRTLIPSFAVDALVHQPYGSYPHECYGLYDAEPDHFGVYVDGIKTHGADGVARYLDRYVYEPATHAEYLDLFGPEALESARQRALALSDHPR